ncbi:MAG: hypothetical protein Q9225_006468 [Loekoesia sp. 1 TL-2023]
MSAEWMENTFIDSLVKACSCRQQTRVTPAKKSSSSSFSTYHRARRRNLQSSASQRRNMISTRLQAQTQVASPMVTRDDYRQMLDCYREPYDRSTSSLASRPSLSDLPVVGFDHDNIPNKEPENPQIQPQETWQSENSAGQAVAGSVSQAESNGSSIHHPRASLGDCSSKEDTVASAEAESPQSILRDPLLGLPAMKQEQDMERLKRLLEDETSSHEQIYEAYLRLPSPGVRHLSAHNRRLLLHRLSVIEFKTKSAMLRYLSLVDDMKEASIPLTISEWNTAIAYAGRCFACVGAAEVEFALRIWKEMEQEAGVRSGSVTFNILFDIATKAGKYVLADMILKEMETRGLEYTRFSHVGFIYYHGMKGDGAGVRRAYRDFVEAGQIVDTAVLNCVIASLIRAGELPAAEQVFGRMKRLLYRKTARPVPSLDWRYSRNLGRALDKAFRTRQNDEQRLRQLQAEQFLGPNLRTFFIFIDHHVHATGELRRVTVLLEEMQILRIPMHGRIFLKIFKGFAIHGGVKYTSWTRQKLETVWTSLLLALDQEMEGVHMMKWMVVWAIRAFARCCGKDRTLQIWEQVRDRWRISEEDEKGAIEHLLRNVLDEIRVENGHR